MNKLPNLYTNTFDKKIDNSLDYINLSKSNDSSNNKLTKNEILKKIDNIFKSNNYVYKINVIINTNYKEEEYTLIGKTKNYLITMDNKLININDINDIKKVD